MKKLNKLAYFVITIICWLPVNSLSFNQLEELTEESTKNNMLEPKSQNNLFCKKAFYSAKIEDVVPLWPENEFKPFEGSYFLKLGNYEANLAIYQKEPSKTDKFLIGCKKFFSLICSIFTKKNQKNGFELVELREVFIAKKTIYRDKISKRFNDENEKCLDNNPDDDETYTKKIVFLYKGGHDNGIDLSKDKSIYYAKFLLLKFFLENSNYWRINKLDPENFPSIKLDLNKLKILSTEPVKITPKAYEKYSDLNIITAI